MRTLVAILALLIAVPVHAQTFLMEWATESIYAVTVGTNGTVYVSGTSVVMYTKNDGTVIPGTDALFRWGAEAFACAPDGTVWEVANGWELYRLTSDGRERLLSSHLGDPGDGGAQGNGFAFVGDNVYITLRAWCCPQVVVITPNGDYVGGWLLNGHPRGIASDAAGNLYVSDVDHDRIDVYSSAGTLLRSWGTSGSASGQLHQPWGVAVDATGRVYVVDNGNHRVQVFTGTGEYITEFGKYGTSPGEFTDPVAIALDADGVVYVGDGSISNSALTGRIEKFGAIPVGTATTTWGSLKARYR